MLSWLDYRWGALWARVDHDRHPRAWCAGMVPLSTWLTHPRAGWESYRRHVVPTLQQIELDNVDRQDP